MPKKVQQLFDIEDVIRKDIRNPKKVVQYVSDELTPYARTPLAILTLPVKIKPDFFVIEAAKSGTASLREYLLGHGAIHMTKELGINVPNRVWQTDHWRNRARYHSLLDKRGHKGECITFEKNVNYLIDFRIPKRMHQHNPEAKSIVLMRNPIDRTIRQYYHNQRKPNREKLSFREAIEREESRIEPKKTDET